MTDIALAKGGHADVLTLSDTHLTVRSPIPSAPGSTLEGRVGGDGARVLLLKVRSCKKEPEGTFVIDGRAVNFTRELRASLEDILARRATEPR